MENKLIIIILILFFLVWRFRLKKVAVYNSKFSGKIEILQKYNHEQVLMINNYAQGISTNSPSIKQSYWYFLANQAVKHCRRKKNPSVLIYGLGANTTSSIINKLNSQIKQTIVEIDPQIITVCKNHFNLNELKNCQIINQDAFKLLLSKNPFHKKFDVIIVDIFTGIAPFVSKKSNQPNFITKSIRHLKSDGLILFNRPGQDLQTLNECHKLQIYLSTLFQKSSISKIIDPRGYKNNIILANHLS